MGSDAGDSRAITRVLAVLEQLSASPRALTNHELANAVGAPHSSMHRLLQKLEGLGYLECDADTLRYAAAARLSALARRLGEAGGKSEALRDLVTSLSEQGRCTVTVWVPYGVHVRLFALSAVTAGQQPSLPEDVREPFSTPGLAIATQYSPQQVRALITMARRRGVRLGRGLRTVREVEAAIAQVQRRGYARGYNLIDDGWGVLAWPVPITLQPMRLGALVAGAPVSDVRRRERELVTLARRLRQGYVTHLAAGDARPLTSPD